MLLMSPTASNLRLLKAAGMNPRSAMPCSWYESLLISACKQQ